MNDSCKNCSKQYFCTMQDIRLKLNPINCKDFVSWMNTENFGEVERKKDEE